jgi:Ca2+-binding EF-hand superfamily protein
MTRHSIARLTILSALCILLHPDARAQQVGPGAINYQELFATLDANNDMAIVRGEVPESARPAFDRLLKLGDKNGDGKLERDEYRDLLLSARDSATSAQTNRFATLDKDGDGKLSRQEFPGAPSMFDQLDADKDGSVSRKELAAGRPGVGTPGLIVARLKTMDKNGDGKITREEFNGFGPNFERVDANKDGVIDPEEIRAFLAAKPPEGAPEKK